MAMAAAISTINDASIHCSICLDIFDDPRLLPCGHVYCRHCLVTWAKFNCTFIPKCPNCSFPFAEEYVESGNLDDLTADILKLPVDLSIVAMVDAHRFMNQDHACVCCEAPASFLCKDCADKFCDDCQMFHKKQTATKHHELALLAAVKASDGLFSSRSPTVCPQHAGCGYRRQELLLNLFCPTHNEPICQMCTVSSKHGRCRKAMDLSSAVDGMRGSMSELMRTLKDMAGQDGGKGWAPYLQQNTKDMAGQDGKKVQDVPMSRGNMKNLADQKDELDWLRRVPVSQQNMTDMADQKTGILWLPVSEENKCDFAIQAGENIKQDMGLGTRRSMEYQDVLKVANQDDELEWPVRIFPVLNRNTRDMTDQEDKMESKWVPVSQQNTRDMAGQEDEMESKWVPVSQQNMRDMADQEDEMESKWVPVSQQNTRDMAGQKSVLKEMKRTTSRRRCVAGKDYERDQWDTDLRIKKVQDSLMKYANPEMSQIFPDLVFDMLKSHQDNTKAEKKREVNYEEVKANKMKEAYREVDAMCNELEDCVQQCRQRLRSLVSKAFHSVGSSEKLQQQVSEAKSKLICYRQLAERCHQRGRLNPSDYRTMMQTLQEMLVNLCPGETLTRSGSNGPPCMALDINRDDVNQVMDIIDNLGQLVMEPLLSHDTVAEQKIKQPSKRDPRLNYFHEACEIKKPTKQDPTQPTKRDPKQPTKRDPKQPTKGDPKQPTKKDPKQPTKKDPKQPTKKDPKEPTKRDPQLKWYFHEACDYFLTLHRKQRTAERSLGRLGHGKILSQDPMEVNKLYEVLVDEVDESQHSSHMTIGVVGRKPGTFAMPRASHLFRPGVMIRSYAIIKDSIWIKATQSFEDLLSIEVGSRVGLLLDSDSKVHVYLNGKDIGEVEPLEPFQVAYAMFDLSYYLKKLTTLPVRDIRSDKPTHQDEARKASKKENSEPQLGI